MNVIIQDPQEITLYAWHTLLVELNELTTKRTHTTIIRRPLKQEHALRARIDTQHAESSPPCLSHSTIPLYRPPPTHPVWHRLHPLHYRLRPSKRPQ